MSETHGTTIEWTHGEGFKGETWNPTTGCDIVSPGCARCYALALAERLKAMGSPAYQKDGDPKTSGPGFGLTLHEDRLELPLRWKKPRMVFVDSMSDLFHEEIPARFVAQVFAVMSIADQHVFQVLTKRPERARAMLTHPRFWLDVNAERLGRCVQVLPGGMSDTWPSGDKTIPNVWIGVSIENARYTWRADVLREIPAAVRFISAEPLLGSLFEKETRQRIRPSDSDEDELLVSGVGRKSLDLTGIDWLIVGGESGGRDARPMHPQWARELRDACLERSGHVVEGGIVPAFFFKQWGSWSPERPSAWHGRSRPEQSRTIVGLLPSGKHADTGPDPAEQLASTWLYYHGAGPKSGGRLLDGREWNEMPAGRT